MMLTTQIIILIVASFELGCYADSVKIKEITSQPVDGDDLKLTCVVESRELSTDAVSWTIPTTSTYISGNCSLYNPDDYPYLSIDCGIEDNKEFYSLMMVADFERDHGTYKCDMMPAPTDSLDVDIFKLVSSIIVSDDVSVKEGDNEVLSCSTTDCGYPEPTITWTLNEDTIEEDNEETVVCQNYSDGRISVGKTSYLDVTWSQDKAYEVYQCCAYTDGFEERRQCDFINVTFVPREGEENGAINNKLKTYVLVLYLFAPTLVYIVTTKYI